MLMRIRKYAIPIIMIISITALLIPIVALASNDHVYYGPAPPPVVYVKYVISMNLTDSRPTVSFLQSIESSYPMLYKEDTLVTNTTTVWVGTANREFTLYIINATPTSINVPVLLNATATSNFTGGVVWVLKVPLQLVFPQTPVYAQWYVVITEDVYGSNYVVFLFKTDQESLSQLLSELATVGGYLIATNGEPYYLWHHYYGYNPTTGTVGTYYEVGLPGISIFYTWVGQGVNASSWPQQGFNEVLRSFEFSFAEYVNYTLVKQVELPTNETVGQLTNYGYEIYGRPRLIPFGPFTYTSPILLLSNGTVINPACLSGTYFPLTVSEILASGALFPVYIYSATPTGLYVLNGSLVFGGYALAYDFFNETALPLTTEQYLTPLYSTNVSLFTACTLQIYTMSNYNYNDTATHHTIATASHNIINNATTDLGQTRTTVSSTVNSDTVINDYVNHDYLSNFFALFKEVYVHYLLRLVYALLR